jgi:cbb3-type cytochrome oxidase subunit 1
MFLLLTIGGIIQGFEMNQAGKPLGQLVHDQGIVGGTIEFFRTFKAKSGEVPFIEIVKDTRPWLIARSASGILMFIGHIAFAVLIYLNLTGRGARRIGPTLFQQDPDGYAAAMAPS